MWLNAHASGIHVLYVDSSSGEELAEKTYVHGKRALGAIRTKLAKLGICTEKASVAADVSHACHGEGSNGNRREPSADRAPVESLWRKVPVAFVLHASRSRACCEVVGEVGELPDGGFEAKVTFEGRTRTWEFDTEWKAKNFVLVKLGHLLGGRLPCRPPFPFARGRVDICLIVSSRTLPAIRQGQCLDLGFRHLDCGIGIPSPV